MNSDNLKFFFLHIPKTAGTMMSSIMRSNFKNEFHQDHVFYADLFYEPWHIEDALRIVPYTCISSHALRATSLLPPKNNSNVIAFTFIRDPKDLAVSCYFDLRNRVSGAQHPSQSMEIYELTKKWKEAGFRQEYAYSVSQINWLYPNVKDKFEKFKEDLASKKYHLFPTERFDEAMLCLETLYPDHFSDCSYGAKKNASKQDYDLSEDDFSAVASLPWIKEDIELHFQSNKYLDSLLLELFDSISDKNKALEAFRNRGHKKAETRIKKKTFYNRGKKLIIKLLKIR